MNGRKNNTGEHVSVYIHKICMKIDIRIISTTGYKNKPYLCSICRSSSERQLRMVAGTEL